MLRFDRRRFGALVALSLVFGALLTLLWASGIPVHDLLVDQNVAAGVPPLYGVFAVLGLIGWAAAAAFCALAGLVLRSWQRAERSRFMLWTAVLLSGAALDDALQFHEDLGPEIGIPELATYVVLAGAAATWMWVFRRSILRSELGLLGAALGCLALSVGLDVVGSVPIQAEDPWKLVGIAAFAAWTLGEALDAIAEGPAGLGAPVAPESAGTPEASGEAEPEPAQT